MYVKGYSSTTYHHLNNKYVYVLVCANAPHISDNIKFQASNVHLGGIDRFIFTLKVRNVLLNVCFSLTTLLLLGSR